MRTGQRNDQERSTEGKQARRHETREATQGDTGREGENRKRIRQASKERPARLVAGTGRETIRNHTRTQGTRTDAGAGMKHMRHGGKDEDDTGRRRSKQRETMTTDMKR